MIHDPADPAAIVRGPRCTQQCGVGATLTLSYLSQIKDNGSGTAYWTAMGRNYLAHRAGDTANVVLAAAGYNFRLLLRWLRFLFFRILAVLNAQIQINPA